MSPIASIPAAFTYATTVPSLPVDPGSAVQSASTSQYLVGTGGILFAAVVIASVVGYFHHGRKKTTSPPKNSWATFSKFLSLMRHREPGTPTTAAGGDWPADVEGGPEHVDVIYTTCFHPTLWNPVESHPRTSSAPAIYVEEESKEDIASKPKVNSLPDMDDDDGGDSAKDASQATTPQVAEVSLHDTSIHFRSEIIGTTDRTGVFLAVPGQYRDGSLVTSSNDNRFRASPASDIDPVYSPHDGIIQGVGTNLTCSLSDTPLPNGVLQASSDSQEVIYSPHGAPTPLPRSSDGPYESMPDVDFRCSPFSGIMTDVLPDTSHTRHVGMRTSLSRPFPDTRRYGKADMTDLAKTLQNAIPQEGHGLVRTIACRSGLCDLADFDETDSASYRHLNQPKAGHDNPTASSCGVSASNGPDNIRRNWTDPATFGPLYESLDLLQMIVDEQEDDGDPVRAVNHRSGSCDPAYGGETDAGADLASHRYADQLKPMEVGPTCSRSSAAIHDGPDNFRKIQDWACPDTFGRLYEGLDLLQRVIDDFDDSDVDSISRSHSRDADFRDGQQDGIDERGTSHHVPTWDVDSPDRVSPEWASSASDEESIYPVTPSRRSTTSLLTPPCVYQSCMGSPFTPRFSEEVRIVAPTYSSSPPWLPCEAYVCAVRPRRPLLVVCDSPPRMPSRLQMVAPGVYEAHTESLVAPLFTEEVEANCLSSPWLQSKAYVCARRPMVRGPYLLPCRV